MNMIMKTGGGQKAGQLELLENPEAAFFARARALADSLFHQHQGGGVDLHLTKFDEGLSLGRDMAAQGYARRNEMPVIDEADLEDLKRALAKHGINEICDVCVIMPEKAVPTQCQIYVDKALEGTAKFGVEGTKNFLGSNHLVVDSELRIVDGHHRWLSSLLIDRKMELPAFKIKFPLRTLMGILLDFSDARHARNG